MSRACDSALQQPRTGAATEPGRGARDAAAGPAGAQPSGTAAGRSPHVDTHGSGPPLVLLHGWGLHGGLFAPLLPALTPRHRVAVIDLPGHGRSSPVEPYTLDALTDAVAGTIDAPATVLGWSMGGLVALRLAQRHPRCVARLVLVCTSPRFVAGDDWPHAMAAQTLARFGDELAVAYRLTLQRFLSLQVQGSEDGRRTLAAMRGALFARGEPAREALAAGLDILASTDLRADVPSIDVPALVVTGQRDALTPAGAGAWLARALPRARHVGIAGAAHAPFLSHPAGFEAALEAFLHAG
jgi:pimeloyl-[acyl-carrier protein] methyl ester esterase